MSELYFTATVVFVIQSSNIIFYAFGFLLFMQIRSWITKMSQLRCLIL